MKRFLAHGLVVLAVLMMGFVVQANVWAVTIDNFPKSAEFGGFGEFNTAYYAQSFISPISGVQSVLGTLTFELATVLGPDDVEFRLLITETTGGPGTGIRPTNVLFESDRLTLPFTKPEDALFTTFDVDLGGLVIEPAITYAWVLDAFVEFDMLRGVALTGSNDNYSDGHLFILNDVGGQTRADHFAAVWSGPMTQDFTFKLGFEPIPEPSTMLLLGSGLAGLGVFRMRRKDRKNPSIA